MDGVLACSAAPKSRGLQLRPWHLGLHHCSSIRLPHRCTTGGDTRAAPAATYQVGTAGHAREAYRPHLQRTAPGRADVQCTCYVHMPVHQPSGRPVTSRSPRFHPRQSRITSAPGPIGASCGGPRQRAGCRLLRILAGGQERSAAAQGCTPPAMIADGRRTSNARSPSRAAPAARQLALRADMGSPQGPRAVPLAPVRSRRRG